ncbi:hypothetical protein [Pontibacter chitinilyticus]|uniref:hypothetical protein n=1 Tax=Pontibacter chitinilyticus TaxID=2674989 RepID=UPI0032199F16
MPAVLLVRERAARPTIIANELAKATTTGAAQISWQPKLNYFGAGSPEQAE